MDYLVKALITIDINGRNTAVIKIQRWIRSVFRMNILITGSQYQTKDWRKARAWYDNGKRNECEKYQIRIIQLITQIQIETTDNRIKMDSSLSLINIKNPIRHDDGFEYTENLDGVQRYGHYHLYYNLKFVCDSGGAQTRTLREVYHFIRYQLQLLLKGDINMYFINILDGDNSYKSMNKFKYLQSKPEYAHIKKYVFIDDMQQFQVFWLKTLIYLVK